MIYVSKKRDVYLGTIPKHTDILKDMPNISVKDRSLRAKKLLTQLEKATNELKTYSPSLSMQTAEEREVAFAWKEYILKAMACRVEELKILSSNRELTKDDLEEMIGYDNKHLAYYNEMLKQEEKLDAFIK